MTLNSSRIFLASQGMLTERVRCGTAWTPVSLAECTAESKTNSYTDGAVIEMKPAGTDRDCMKLVGCYPLGELPIFHKAFVLFLCGQNVRVSVLGFIIHMTLCLGHMREHIPTVYY